jgi:hypothetical protein
MIVDDICQVVSRISIRFEDDEILLVFSFLKEAKDRVAKLWSAKCIAFEAQKMCFASSSATIRFLSRYGTTSLWVSS